MFSKDLDSRLRGNDDKDINQRIHKFSAPPTVPY